jgi:predicted DNA-binding protein with PD1-like motif
MKTGEGKIGRVFVIRLEDGDLLPTCLEDFAQKRGIKNGFVLLVGGIGSGQIVVGPRFSDKMPPDPMLIPIDGAHEVVAAGILAPGADNRVVLHIHGSLGRSGQTRTGCLRPGVSTWLVGEAIMYEITGVDAKRVRDKKSGFELLEINSKHEIRNPKKI